MGNSRTELLVVGRVIKKSSVEEESFPFFPPFASGNLLGLRTILTGGPEEISVLTCPRNLEFLLFPFFAHISLALSF
jgi:hypothetical protein